MNIRQPHDIIDIAEDAKAPDGYVEITRAERCRLERMSPQERNRWLAERGIPTDQLRK